MMKSSAGEEVACKYHDSAVSATLFVWKLNLGVDFR